MDARRAEQIKQAREMEFREIHGCSREAHGNRANVGYLYQAPPVRGDMSRTSSVSSQGSVSVKLPTPSLIKAGDDIWR